MARGQGATDHSDIVLADFPEAAQKLLSTLDQNGDGTVDATELATAASFIEASRATDKGGAFAIASLPSALQKSLKAFDVDGDGTIMPLELARGAELYVASKDRVKQLTRLAVALLLLMGVMLGAITGLTFTVVELSKDTKVSDGTMMVKGNDNTFLKVASASAPATLSSCLPSSYLEELKNVHIKSGLAEINLQVLGFVRMPRANSLYGTVVMLVTHLGRVVVDGETLSYVDDIGTVFADAGFNVDMENRRLLDVLDLVGLFNSMPDEAWDCYDPATDGPTPTFPSVFVAEAHKLEPCVDTEGVDHCDSATEGWQTAALTTIDGNTFAQAHGRVIVGAEQGFSREEWVLPSRAPDFTRVTMRNNQYKWSWMSANKPEAALAASSDFSDHVTSKSSGDTPDPAVAANAGFYCKRVTVGAGGVSLSDILNAEYNAAYMGVVTLDGTSARHWIINPKGDSEDVVLHLYDARQPAGDYMPVRYELYSIANNKLLTRYDFSSWKVGAEATAILDVTEPATSHLPDLCYWYGTNDIGGTDVANGVVRGMPDGNSVVPIEQLLLSSSPFPMADGPIEVLRIVSEDMGALAASQGRDNSDERAAAEAEDRRRGLLSDGEGRRKLQGYSCCKFAGGDAITREFDPFLKIIINAPPLTTTIEVGAAVGYGPSPYGGDAMMCALEIGASADMGIGFNVPLLGGVSAVVEVGGSVYGDWDNSDPGSCTEVGGCVTASLTFKFRFLGIQQELDLLEFAGCVIAGVGGDTNGVVRNYIALQLSATVTIKIPSVLRFEATGSLFLKYFYPHPEVGNGDTMHFHPFLQLDIYLHAAGTGYDWPSYAWNLLSPPMKPMSQ